MTRFAVMLPLLWLAAAYPLVASAKHRTKASPTGTAAAQVDFSNPTTVLGTPDRTVEIFRLTRHENPRWSYMVVVADQDGTHVSYGDEHTVGSLVESLAQDLHDSPRSGRCPAAAHWHFDGQYKAHAVKVSYCREGIDTDRIERATQFLATTPTVD